MRNDDDDHATATGARRSKRAADAVLLRRGGSHRSGKPLLEFDALAAYLGLLIGITAGAVSPVATPLLADAAVQLCAVGALEVGRDGIAECLPP